MSFAQRLKQEVAAAQCKQEAELIIDRAKPELDAMEPHEKEQLLTQVADLFRELPD